MSRRPCTVPGCPNTTRRGSGRCHEHRYADRDAREPGPPPAAATARAAAAGSVLRTALGDDARIETVAFVSGAVALTVRRGPGVVSVLGSPSGGEWRVRAGPGRDHVVASVEDVAAVLRALGPGPG